MHWSRPAARRRLSAPLAVAVVIAIIGLARVHHTGSAATPPPPPAGGYFQLVPAGQFANLPSDAAAAAMVHRSPWEPRSSNYAANHLVAPATFKQPGYSGMLNHAAVFGRVTGNFTGTTDEIIQWAAAKWGLPDEVIRADAVAESYWWQNHKDASGNPIQGQGYGDFGSCVPGAPAPSGYGTGGPSSYGLLQVKWCSMEDSTAQGWAGWPYTETSTAYSLDSYGAVIRGCYEGYDTWLGGSYAAGDLWGCLGRWFSGQWHSAGADNYINTVQGFVSTRPWATWADESALVPSSSPTATPSGSVAPKRGDINGDGKVNVFDLSALLLSWGATGAADLNGSGRVDVLDLSILLSSWSA